jgi:DNA replication protein DnaC
MSAEPTTPTGNIPLKALTGNYGDRLSTAAENLLQRSTGAAIQDYRAGGKSVGTSQHIAAIPLGDKFGPEPMTTLAWLARHPENEFRQLVDAVCSQGCGAKFKCMKLFAGATCCDECRAKWEAAEFKEKMGKKWDLICPKRFRDTDKNHPGFARQQYAALTSPVRWSGQSSLFLYGPTGQCKTRVAMMMLKRALIAGYSVGVLWPEKMRGLISGYTSEVFDSYANVGVLVMDDLLLTACRESRLIEALKQLVDVRMREERATIFTSQIGAEKEITEAKEFGDAKEADVARIQALLRRLREAYKIVAFDPAPVATEQAVSF